MLLFAILILALLKLTGIIGVSWLFVIFAPVLVSLALFIVIFLLSFFGILVGGFALSRFIR